MTIKVYMQKGGRTVCIGDSTADKTSKEYIAMKDIMNGDYKAKKGMYFIEIGTEDDLYTLLDRSAPECGRPALRMRCGDADFLISENREFVKRAQSANWSVDYAESPGDGHTWEFWMAELPGIFDFFSK